MANTINEAAIKKLKLVITVVDRAKAEFYLDVFSQFEVNFQMVTGGIGTAHSEIVEMLGLNVHKAVIMSVVREDKVKIKLNPVVETVKGKRVILVDDSIVRGTTMVRVVKLLRDAGATEIHVRSSAPQFLNPCYYGTDIASREVLIACHHTPEEMAKMFGADSVGFLPLEDVFKLGEGGKCTGYCAACFNGDYPTEQSTADKSKKYDQKISEMKNE